MTDALTIHPRSHQSESAALFAAARSHSGVVAVLIAVAGLAWWSTANQMAGMDAGPGTQLGALGWFAAVWVVMMAAMMLPSLAPTAAIYATLTGRREPSRWLLFTGGYLFVWSATGFLAYGLFALGEDLLASDLAWPAGGRWLAAGVLIIAAVYELTSTKRACLSRCRSPQRSLHSTWREGRVGAVLMGMRNGGWCLGCSWALMAALLALGVMSLSWMGFVAAVVALEKLSPRPRAATITAAALLGALGVAILIAPHDIPTLTVPHPHARAAMQAMKAMG